MVQPLPIPFYFPNKRLVCIKLLGKALGGRFAHLERPQIIGDEMVEIAQPE
jgi:hypothetical protein